MVLCFGINGALRFVNRIASGPEAFYKVVVMSFTEWFEIGRNAYLMAVICSAGVYVSYGLTARLFPSVRRSVFMAAAALVFFFLATAGFHVLAALARFRMPMALLLSLLASVCCHAAVMPIAEFARRLAGDVRGPVRAVLRASPVLKVIVIVTCGLVSLKLSKTLLIPPLGWDAVSYHMAKAAMWIQHGRLQTLRGPGGWSYFPLFPGGGDLIYAWAMLPFRSDLFASFAGGLIWMATGLATYALARSMRVTHLGAFTATILVMFTSAVQRITGSGYVEPVLQLYSVLMAVCAVSYLYDRNPRWLTLALAGVGLMAGVKVMGLVLGGAAFFMLTLNLIVRHRRERAHWIAWGIGAMLSLVAVAPWWWRAIVETGRPLSPIPIRLFGLELGRINPDLQWIQVRPTAFSSLEREWETLRTLFFWNAEMPGLGLLWAVLFVLLPMAVWRLRWGEHRAAALFLAALVAAFLVGYYHPEMLVLRTHWSTSNARYWIQILPLAAALLSAAMETIRGGRVAWASFILIALLVYVQREAFWGVSGVTLVTMPWVATGMFVGILLAAFMVSRGWWIEFAITTIVAIPILTARLADYRDATRWTVYRDEGTKSYHGLLRYWVNAAEQLDQPGVTHRIAVTSAPWQNGDNWLVYPFLGCRFQNEIMYIPISESGEIVPFDGTARYLETSHPAAWIARLYKNGISHVMSFWPPSIEGYWMLHHPAFFEPISVSRKWGGCFWLRPWPEAQRLLESREPDP